MPDSAEIPAPVRTKIDFIVVGLPCVTPYQAVLCTETVFPRVSAQFKFLAIEGFWQQGLIHGESF